MRIPPVLQNIRLHRQTWSIALPMMLANLTVPLLGIVDTAVIGHLPNLQYLGGVAIGAMIFTFLLWGFGFLRMGTTGLTAQAYGAEDNAVLQATLIRSLLLAIILSACILLLQKPILSIALLLVSGSNAVETFGSEYFSVRIWSVPAVLIRYVLLGWFLGLQKSRPVLYITIFINGLNIILDFVFVMLLGMDVAGVALATVIAEYTGLLFAALFILPELKRFTMKQTWNQIFEITALQNLLHINHQIFIRTLLLIFTFGFFTAQSAKLGDAVLAANAVLKNFLLLLSFGLDGLAHAAEALVGRAVGNKNRQRFLQYVTVTGFWSIVGAIIYTLLFIIFGSYIIALLTDITAVRNIAQVYLPWLYLAPLIGVWSYWLDGVFIGATQTRAMREVMLLSTILYLIVWYFTLGFGNHGLWVALLAFLAFRGIAMSVAFIYIDRRQGFLK